MAAFSPRELVLARLSHTRDNLHVVIARLTDEVLDWAPADGMRTVGGQLAEIAGTEIELLAKLRRGPDISLQEAQRIVGDPASLAGLKRALEESRSETLGYIASLTDDELESPAGVPQAWQETVGLVDAPVAEVLRGIAQHEAYHTGQLVTYLWARGDNPYRW